MLKMAASLLLILGGAGIGYARSREITEREKNLEILLQILFFLKGEIRCGNSSLPDAFREIAAKISGFFGTILRDAAQEMEDTGGKNLEEIMEFCIQRNFYHSIFQLRGGKKKWRFFGLLGADLAILTEKCR